jgi:hypothetical protein
VGAVIRDPAAPPGTLADPVFGDTSRLDEMRSNRAKGNLLQSRVWYVRDRFGEDTVDQLQRVLPPSAAAIMRSPPVSFAWCSVGDMMDIDRAILEGPMHGEIVQMREFGAAIATHDLPLLYRMLFKIGTPGFFLRRIGIAAGTYIGDSVMTGVDHGPNHVRITQSGKLLPYYFCAYGALGWLEAGTKLSGGKSISVEHVACAHRGAAECAWDVRWK